MQCEFLGPVALGIIFSLLYFSRQSAKDIRALDVRVARMEEKWLGCEERIMRKLRMKIESVEIQK